MGAARSSSSSTTIPNITTSTSTTKTGSSCGRWRSSTCSVNNADRKGGHIFFEKKTHNLYAIDHGICFHEDDKLRTVLWDFSGQKIPAELLNCLTLSRKLLADLQPYLSSSEIAALCTRAETLLKKGVFPRQPRDRRAMPWPPL